MRIELWQKTQRSDRTLFSSLRDATRVRLNGEIKGERCAVLLQILH
ncbi:MAG: hypothetical protein V7K64_14905 [Nostoc sp.]|nr:hypothetical protein [Nostoc sp. JL34]MBN3886415.1 hypothetical protein [Nostoc sp. JL34]